MARKFSELYNKLPPATRERVETRVSAYKTEMALEDLRRERHLTQVNLARNLGINQGAVSKIEKRGDMHVGTLRKHIEAMGGSLQLRAVFPDGEIPLRLRGDKAAYSVRKTQAIVPPARVPKISESFNIQFRAELFNVANHVNYATPPKAGTQLFNRSGAALTTGGVLIGPTDSSSRQAQFALKVLF